MDSFTKHFSFIFPLVTLISSLQIHARESQFFNKIPSHNNNNSEKETQVVKQQEPNFLPENENGYGLYGHESGQLPTSTTTNVEDHETKPTNNFPNSKCLPKNYNPVAYVTVPEDNIGETKFMNNEFTTNPSTNNNKNYKGVSAYNSNNDVKEYYSHASINNNNNNDDEYHNGGSTYSNNKNRKQGLIWDKSPTNAYPTSKNNNDNNQEQSNPMSYNHNYNSGKVLQQGISDTRFLENGKYFYDGNTEKYARYPYDNSREFAASNGNNEFHNNFVENNNQNEEEFQLDDEEMP